MTNQEIRARMERIANGDLLSLDEQQETLNALLRANRRIIEAKKQGFDPDRTHARKASTRLEEWTDEESSTADKDAQEGDPFDPTEVYR